MHLKKLVVAAVAAVSTVQALPHNVTASNATSTDMYVESVPVNTTMTDAGDDGLQAMSPPPIHHIEDQAFYDVMHACYAQYREMRGWPGMICNGYFFYRGHDKTWKSEDDCVHHHDLSFEVNFRYARAEMKLNTWVKLAHCWTGYFRNEK
ncbi:hypothetical protein BJ170DRAFT_597244 [Xylariales sp. AK1849]|nr:hypothetical protein BJ170DRAFT_597244 [Xylariales sp. AK1849]